MDEENKEEICQRLLPALQATNNLRDLKYLIYEKIDDYTEIVSAVFENGHVKHANVSMDSGTSMIRDIISQIV